MEDGIDDHKKTVGISGGLKGTIGGIGISTYPTEDDDWKHRSTKMSCRTCMWFVVKVNNIPTKPILGRCQRRCPTINGYPAVYCTDWCGDHRLDENKP